MTPTIVLDESGVAAIAGGSGGPRIISATAQVLLNTLMLGLPADDAVRAPRIHHQWQPATLYAEPPLDEDDIARGLKRRGHAVAPRSMIGCVQLIARQGHAYAAACDPRKGGRPAGIA
jgi:gamma-glutamyltranspeptidase